MVDTENYSHSVPAMRSSFSGNESSKRPTVARPLLARHQPIERRWSRFSVCLLVALSACSQSPGEDAGVPERSDAGAPSDHEGVLELGTGDESFLPVSDDDLLGLSRGIQGLQHVYVSLRVREVDPELAITEIVLARQSDGVAVNEPFRVRLPYVAQAERAELVGAQLVVPDEERVFGEPLVLTARIEDRHGAWAEASAQVRVVWEDEL